jgi:hypothetical protein
MRVRGLPSSQMKSAVWPTGAPPQCGTPASFIVETRTAVAQIRAASLLVPSRRDEALHQRIYPLGHRARAVTGPGLMRDALRHDRPPQDGLLRGS